MQTTETNCINVIKNGGINIMNMKSTLKALAVALPLSVAPVKASAQAAQITEGAQKVLTASAKDTLKVAAQDARTVVLKQYNGHYKGSVVNGKVGSGALDYAERGKTALYEENVKPNVHVGASFLSADKLPSAGLKIEGGLVKEKNGFDVSFAYASKNGYSDMIADASYKRVLPLGSGFQAYGKAGANSHIYRQAVVGGDHYGRFTPYAEGGISYDHKFPNKVTVGASAGVGGGPAIALKANPDKSQVVKNIHYGGEARVGYDKVEVFGRGGHDDLLGKNFEIGGRYKF